MRDEPACQDTLPDVPEDRGEDGRLRSVKSDAMSSMEPVPAANVNAPLANEEEGTVHENNLNDDNQKFESSYRAQS